MVHRLTKMFGENLETFLYHTSILLLPTKILLLLT